MWRVLNAFLLMALALSVQRVSSETPQVVPVPDGKAPRLYVLTPGDIALVKVYQEDDLQTQARIGRDGVVTLPLLGSVKIGGLTLEQASAHVAQLYEDGFLVNPQVSVAVLEYAKRRFTVLGQVQRPGTYDIPGEETLNLLQAISMAGGYTRIGAPWKITLQRTVEGEQRIFKLDAEAMGKDRNAKPFEILPDDTITVGEKII
jgi:polysaccharide export outer membrane protein